MKISLKRSTALLDRPEAPVPSSAHSRAPERDRVLLLVPEGSLSFQLHSFPDVPSAQNYVDGSSASAPAIHWVTLWTHDSKPVDSGGTALPAESVVLLRDASRPGTVQLFSFLDMSAALAYLRTSLPRGLDPKSVLIYWVTPVALAPPPVEDTEPITSTTAGAKPTQVNAAPARASVAERLARDANGYSHPGGADFDAQRAAKQAQQGPSLVRRMSSWFLSWPGWHGLPSRMIEAALLQRETLEEVRRDPHATGRSIVVVFAAAISAGIGAAIAGGLVEGVARVIATTLGWIVCAVTVSVIGRRLFGADESFASREFQTVGLASAPALLLVVGAVPVFGPLFVMGVLGWLLATMTMATRVSLGLDLESSALTAGAGWLLFFAIAVVAPTLFA